MAPGDSDNNPVLSDAGDCSDIDRNAQDQILLTALQELLVPLVQTVVEKKVVMDFKGPEAMNLITALKKFVSNIVGDALHAQKAHRNIQIEKNHIQNDDAAETTNITQFEDVYNQQMTISNAPPTPIETKDGILHKMLLIGLQEHVSNKMPIRLLLIEPHESYLQISLIDRGEIYAHLEHSVKGKNHAHREIRYTLDTTEEYIERLVKSYAKYAILSHTWLRGTPGEITYSQWNKGVLDPKTAGYDKLASFCRTAWNDYGITLAWMDTVCINKDSSSELDESIRSMYAWYERANICIVYLSETTTVSEIPNDSWFTRGWTLQELLAPKFIKFYSSAWTQLDRTGYNDRFYLQTSIEQATTISFKEIEDTDSAPFSRRMQWAASRKVTREEDMAYSLMGIFGVSISIAYGEGADRSFYRLLEEIMRSHPHSMLDLFNWASDCLQVHHHTSLLPSTPQQYIHRSTKISLHYDLPRDPITLTPRGICIPVILMPGISIDPQDPQSKSFGDYSAIVEVSWPEKIDHVPATYYLLHKDISEPDRGYIPRQRAQLTFAVFNIARRKSLMGAELAPGIHLPKTCIAVVLKCNEDAGKVTGLQQHWKMRIPTMKPVVFELKSDSNMEKEYLHKEYGFSIPVDHLTRHGMQLISTYL
ncbi:hypothetical protein BDN70DRAFT_841763 [Pholiota conissans]|uniref:Heterokaryon incompatibility domain-containing protein n=1 Tax=Pholiota conissans TaxID=109636 RepID=A0A9P5YUE9_9AGAR|nr:hypothetical protein BDN70DRAFT_841763 [Pholiota conissans]